MKHLLPLLALLAGCDSELWNGTEIKPRPEYAAAKETCRAAAESEFAGRGLSRERPVVTSTVPTQLGVDVIVGAPGQSGQVTALCRTDSTGARVVQFTVL